MVQRYITPISDKKERIIKLTFCQSSLSAPVGADGSRCPYRCTSGSTCRPCSAPAPRTAASRSHGFRTHHKSASPPPGASRHTCRSCGTSAHGVSAGASPSAPGGGTPSPTDHPPCFATHRWPAALSALRTHAHGSSLRLPTVLRSLPDTVFPLGQPPSAAPHS